MLPQSRLDFHRATYRNLFKIRRAIVWGKPSGISCLGWSGSGSGDYSGSDGDGAGAGGSLRSAVALITLPINAVDLRGMMKSHSLLW